MCKFSQDTSARRPVPSNFYTKVHAENLKHTTVIPQTPLPAAASPASMVFNSEQGNCFLSEELEAAVSDSSTLDGDVGIPDLGVSEKMAAGTKAENIKN
jgi:hypothetical protein